MQERQENQEMWENHEEPEEEVTSNSPAQLLEDFEYPNGEEFEQVILFINLNLNKSNLKLKSIILAMDRTSKRISKYFFPTNSTHRKNTKTKRKTIT